METVQNKRRFKIKKSLWTPPLLEAEEVEKTVYLKCHALPVLKNKSNSEG